MLSLYFHIPYCVQKCPYCDFYSHGMEAGEIPESAYVSALEKEIVTWRSRLNWERISESHTLFFGGGTPSLFSAANISQLIAAARERLALSDQAEVSLEMNPKTAQKTKLQEYRAGGVNRLSLGVQTLDDELLKVLGRAHTAKDALESLSWALEVGFSEVSIDLMFGLPSQTQTQLEATLERLKSYPLTHLSAYELILEEHTPFFERYRYERSPLPNSESVLQMRSSIENFGKQLGLSRYEISNWARADSQSRHNVQYWNYDSFIGVGSSAVSFLRWEELSADFQSRYCGDFREKPYGVRITNPRNWKHFILNPEDESGIETEWISMEIAQSEYLMMGLRKTKGLAFADFEQRFSRSFPDNFRRTLDWAEGKGWLQQDESTFALTEAGVLFSNEVIQALLPESASH